MIDLFLERFAQFWLPDGETDPFRSLSMRHRKADGKSLTQFNTGGIIITQDFTVVMTECQPYRELPNWLQIVSPAGSLNRMREEIAKEPKLPAFFLFLKKGEFIPRAWLLSMGDQYVINGPDGPMITINRRNALVSKRLHQAGVGKQYQDAAAELRARIGGGDIPTIDARLQKLAQKVGISTSQFVVETQPLMGLTRDEWELGKKWAGT